MSQVISARRPTADASIGQALKNAVAAAFLTAILTIPVLGLQLRLEGYQVVLTPHWRPVWIAVAGVFLFQLFAVARAREIVGEAAGPARDGRAAAARDRLGAARGRARVAVLRLARRSGRRDARADLRDPRPRAEHRGGFRGAAGSRLCRVLRGRRLYVRDAEPVLRAVVLGMPAARRDRGRDVRLPARLPGAAPARRLSRDRHARLRRNHPPAREQPDEPHGRRTASRAFRSRPCSATRWRAARASKARKPSTN